MKYQERVMKAESALCALHMNRYADVVPALAEKWGAK